MPNQFTFSAVEELEETARDLGWRINYYQIDKGPFSSSLKYLAGEDLFLASPRYNNHILIQCEVPEGFIAFCFPYLSNAQMMACGKSLTEGDLFVLPTNSGMEFLNKGQQANETVYVPETKFLEAATALAPSVSGLIKRPSAIYQGNLNDYVAIQDQIRLIHRIGRLDTETASNLLAQIILWLDKGALLTDAELLKFGSSARIARLAQCYIEENFRNAIHLSDLCSFVGVSMRTIQRCFANYFQTTPLQYIKARRLNTIRRELLASNSQCKTVTEIALACGFSHIGRFSNDYRLFFGELPSESLKKIEI